MSRYLIRTLVIPISAATVMSLIVGYFVPWQGLFVNLATSFLSVLITIIYVDRILQEHDRKVWAKVSGLIRQRADKFGNSALLEIRLALGYSHNVFDRNVFDSYEPDKVKAEVIRVTEKIIIPSVLDKLQEMDNATWGRVASALEKIVTQGDGLINLYGNKLDPDLLQTVLEIQNKASGAFTSYSIIPDLLGVPKEKFSPQKRASTLGYRDATIKLIADAICQISVLALRLINLPEK